MLLKGYVAEDILWDYINEDKDFNEFVGKCVTHFNEFVYPNRNHHKIIRQDYIIPERIECIMGDRIWITKSPEKDKVYIDFSGIAIPDDLE